MVEPYGFCQGVGRLPTHSGRALQSCMVQGVDGQTEHGTGAHDAPGYGTPHSPLPRHCDVVTFLKFLNSFITL